MPPALQNPFVLWFVLTAALAAAAYFGVRKELRVRATLYGSFLLACLVALWPPYDRDGQQGKIRLGLDLKGGIHLVMQVVTDDALVATIDDQVQLARDQANRKGIVYGSMQRDTPTSFKVEGVEPARVKDMRDLLRDFFRDGWDVVEPSAGALRGEDERALRTPAADADREGGDDDAGAPHQPAGRRRADHRPARREGRPDPDPAARRAGRRGGQAASSRRPRS